MTMNELAACVQGWARAHGAAPKGISVEKKEKLTTMLKKARGANG